MKPDKTPFYVALGGRFSYVRGLDTAHQRLADYLGITLEAVKDGRRRRTIAGLIQRVPAKEARAAGV